MKKKWKYYLQRLLVNNISYTFFYPFIFIAGRLKASRYSYKNRFVLSDLELTARKIFKEKIVLNGPFKGMQYGNVKGYGSSYYAKLLGSYESEIHPYLKKMFSINYQSVINIGCDDGYYATGFAMHFKDVVVYAYDSNPKALTAAKKLSALNQVENKIIFGSIFTRNMADAIDTTPKLIMVDCEGDEMNIFSKINAANFCNSNAIIELHLQLYPEAVAHFSDLFSATHNIEIINSIPDHLKAMTYDFPEIKDLGYHSRHYILAERDVFMQWILLSSKTIAQ